MEKWKKSSHMWYVFKQFKNKSVNKNKTPEKKSEEYKY